MAMISKAGSYKAKAISAEPGFTKNGNPQVAVLFEVLEGDEAGNRITAFMFFTEKTYERTVESLRACGWKGDDPTDFSGVSDNVVEIVVDTEVYEGATRLRVKWVNDLTAGGRIAMPKPLAAAEKKSFAEQVRGLVRMADHNRKMATGVTSHPADDDIPRF